MCTKTLITKYSEFVKGTYKYDFDSYNLMYLSNGLGGGVGEVQKEVKKMYRLMSKEVSINSQAVKDLHFSQRKKKINKELGDVLWYVFAIANNLNISVEDIIYNNIIKNEKKIINIKDNTIYQ
jgi:NTP pyrophosphatase (non-canonical NTP hydrolase)